MKSEIYISGVPKKACQGCHISELAQWNNARCTSFWCILDPWLNGIVRIHWSGSDPKNQLCIVILLILHSFPWDTGKVTIRGPHYVALGLRDAALFQYPAGQGCRIVTIFDLYGWQNSVTRSVFTITEKNYLAVEALHKYCWSRVSQIRVVILHSSNSLQSSLSARSVRFEELRP